MGGDVPAEKAYLRMLLDEAAILEQQFMCQYLYAAFSLKKEPDATCNAAQFEHVRRWASTLYMIARQEMEHLSIANSLLTATGLDPCFWRFGFPTLSAWYHGETRALGAPEGTPAPCDLPFVLSRFDLTTVQRFACMESPLLADVPADDQPWVLAHCFQDPQGNCPCAPPGDVEEATRFEHAKVHVQAAPSTVEPGTVQELYGAIDTELVRLADAYGEAWLFSGHTSGQSEIPSEYQIYLFPICDLRSARAGVRLIKEQGEGLETAAGYTSHFRHFVDMASDYQALALADPTFVPSMPLPLNPSDGQYQNPVATEAAQLFGQGYYLLLQMLTSYYAHYRTKTFPNYPHLAAAMEQNAFAPAMTMLIRSLAEVMAKIPSGDGATTTGPSFFLPVSKLRTLQNPDLPLYTDINHFIGGIENLVAGLTDLQSKVDPALAPKVEFIVQSMTRVGGKLGYVYQNGIFPKFDPSNPDNVCEHDDACD